MNETVASLQLVAKTEKKRTSETRAETCFFLKNKQSTDTSFEILQGRRN
jgi:hypothetical protein